MYHPKPEILTVSPSGVQAVLTSVEDTTGIFDEDSALRPRPVPGSDKEFIPFGFDNQLPFELIRKVGGDEVTSQNKFFNVLTCYGAGVEFIDEKTKAPTSNPEVKTWQRRQLLPSFFLEQITDMKYFFFSVAVVVLSRDGQKINRLYHKEACYCRLEKADRKGRIRNVFFANWRKQHLEPEEIETIPLLNERDPLGDLLQRMGREPMPNGRLRKTPEKERKFAILLRYPTAGCQYYPVPYYSAIFRGGSYDEKRLISAGKRAKLRNHSSVKYQVEVERGYWERICAEENISDPVKMQERIRKEKECIRDFVGGIENSGKVWISGYYIGPDKQEVRDVRIHNIQSEKEGGDWSDDINVAANTICYGDNVHPNLVGAVPGKSQSNNSGSDKRELFTMKQALEISFHHILLIPLDIVCLYNGWAGVVPSVPMIMLTTLDEHTDALRINPDQQTKEEI